MRKVYMDAAATTPMRKEVARAMGPYFSKIFGNPSSLHFYGQQARKAIEESREKVADLVGSDPSDVIFTSSGTEANNLAIFGMARANKQKGSHLILSAIEHPSVLEPCKRLEKEGFSISYLPVNRYGEVEIRALKDLLTESTIFVSIMHGNNEIGTLQPIEEIARIIQDFNPSICFHVDMIQTAGTIPIDIKTMGVNMASISSHKLYGPKGIGALIIRSKHLPIPLLYGGHQENNLRASTENVPSIVGFGKACELAKREIGMYNKKILSLRNDLQKSILEAVPDIICNGHPERRLPHIAHFSVKNVEGESLILYLSQKGVATSTGSACSSRSLEPSHVLRALEMDPVWAHGSIRFSLSRDVNREDIDYAVRCFVQSVQKLRKISALKSE